MTLYQLLIRLLSPLVLLLILIETLKHKTGRGFFLQRLGLSFPLFPKPVKQRVWLHCASVGEVNAAAPLIRSIQSQFEILITTNTPTGKTVVDTLFADSVLHCYLPMDWPFAINRFLEATQPERCWVLETEIWPNLYRLCQQRQIPISILNARLSQKTLTAPNWLQAAYRQSLQQVTKILARSQAEADRFIALGAPPQKVSVIGNLKHASQPPASSTANPLQREYILLASTQAGEELIISQAWLSLDRPELLVIVPRHPKRSRSIQKQLRPLDPHLKVSTLGQVPDVQTRLFLDDRLGQLLPLFEHAKLVIMGGSFVNKGGHNLLEPARYQKAILTGPYMSDFTDETKLLLRHDGLIHCQNLKDLKQQLTTIIDDPLRLQTLGQHAFKATQTQADILQRYLKALLNGTSQ